MKLQMKKHDYPGKLIAFCGLDGSGKTTQINLLKSFLEQQSLNVYMTKQPTDFVRKSDIFRTYMDEENHDAYDYLALSLLCASDRVQHSNKDILTALKEGKIVISDRYFYSCLANLLARGYENQEWIYEIARSVPQPDIVFFMDIDVETAVQRVRSRPKERDRYIDMELQYRLRDIFLKIAENNNGVVINTANSEQNCFELVKSAVCEVL
ncbi:MAG: dTMP kinase [Clostridiales bacterium]|nr:dTMP kinase [Clostridiales bacterium]